MTKVSVIIPIYNTAPYLPRCLDSLLAQTLDDIEIICVNDCSTDNSAQILQKYALQDNRIKLIDFNTHQGVSIARNTGIKDAQGEYIGFVDSDDYIDSDFYEKLYVKAIETKADIVKGSIVCLDKNLQPYYSILYDVNDEIRLNKAHFYHSFTSCIFNRLFILDKKIYFPEHISHFEDPYFAIKAALYCNKITVIDDARYFYCERQNSETKKELSEQNICDTHSVIKMIVDLLSQTSVDNAHIKIVINFLHEHSIGLCLLTKHNLKAFNLAVKNIEYLKEHFTLLSPLQELKFVVKEDTLLNEYQKYDFLNDKKAQIKIFISYIKPSFLFKSQILTPIQLGCDVEKDFSKDGAVNASDLSWLHNNCIKDNDFEGNISYLNRRVGFYTGTYWAWKNYARLGNPDYFGSFGYRRLLNPSFLKELNQYDLFVPSKTVFCHSMKKQMISVHGVLIYDKMIALMKKVYPEEVLALKNYMGQSEGYFFELYVMKKDLFFNFASWMNKLLQVCIIESSEPIPQKRNDELLFWPPAKGKDIRDIAFIFERLTGYYLYRLTHNSDIKYKETELCLTDEKMDFNVKNVAQFLRERLKNKKG